MQSYHCVERPSFSGTVRKELASICGHVCPRPTRQRARQCSSEFQPTTYFPNSRADPQNIKKGASHRREHITRTNHLKCAHLKNRFTPCPDPFLNTEDHETSIRSFLTDNCVMNRRRAPASGAPQRNPKLRRQRAKAARMCAFPFLAAILAWPHPRIFLCLACCKSSMSCSRLSSHQSDVRPSLARSAELPAKYQGRPWPFPSS